MRVAPKSVGRQEEVSPGRKAATGVECKAGTSAALAAATPATAAAATAPAATATAGGREPGAPLPCGACALKPERCDCVCVCAGGCWVAAAQGDRRVGVFCFGG